MSDEKGCVLISGGSRGLGLSFVNFCLNNNFSTATFARSATPEILKLKEKHKNTFLFGEVDARNFMGMKNFISKVVENFGGIDALVNNAAVGQDHLLANMSEETIDQILTIDLKAPILLTRLVLKQMLLQNRGGRIINISSICGTRGYPGLSVYSATKGALDAFTRSLSREVGARGILVNAIAPGFFSSEMSAVLTKEQMEIIRRRTATEQLTTPENVLTVFRFLLLENSNVSGQVLYIDGGAGI